MTANATELIERLQISLNETLETLAALTDAELDESSDHICATDGTVRDLLTHNIDHDRMHAGQLFNSRYLLKNMQKGEVHRLMVDTVKARAEVCAERCNDEKMIKKEYLAGLSATILPILRRRHSNNFPKCGIKIGL
jgi:hypothetical protein